MRDDDGFTAAEGWIDEWESGAAAYAARAGDLARRLGELSEGDGALSGGDGALPGGDGALPAGDPAAVRRAVAETVGLDSALGRAVVAAHG